MLKFAQIYKDKLQEMYLNIILEDKFKYYANDCWWENKIELSDDTWDSLDFVSIDDEENVLGFIRAKVSRGNEKVTNIEALNFSNKANTIFSRDLYKFIVDIFLKYNFRKIEFTVVAGNPIEKMFDKYVNKYGGRIVGVRKESVKLQDNLFYDSKLYELFKTDFIRNYKKL